MNEHDTQSMPEERAEFFAKVDSMIMAGCASKHIANLTGLRDSTIRKRRSHLKHSGQMPQSALDAMKARHEHYWTNR